MSLGIFVTKAAAQLVTLRGGWASVTLLLALLALAVAAGCDRSSSPAPVPPPDTADQPQHLTAGQIVIGDGHLKVELAVTPEEQQKGMMFRKTLGPDEAMLFIFPRDSNLSFWMKNTLVDLDLAYIRSDGLILQIEHLKAYDLTSVFSRRPARFALEVPPGWFAAHGVETGGRATIPPEIAALNPSG